MFSFPVKELWMCGMMPRAEVVALRKTPNQYLQEWQVASEEGDNYLLDTLRFDCCQFKSLCSEVLLDGCSVQRGSYLVVMSMDFGGQ